MANLCPGLRRNAPPNNIKSLLHRHLIHFKTKREAHSDRWAKFCSAPSAQLSTRRSPLVCPPEDRWPHCRAGALGKTRGTRAPGVCVAFFGWKVSKSTLNVAAVRFRRQARRLRRDRKPKRAARG